MVMWKILQREDMRGRGRQELEIMPRLVFSDNLNER